MRERILKELSEALPKYGLDVNREAMQRLAQYLELLTQWNTKMRLVGDTDPRTLARRHVAESLCLSRLLPLRHQSLVDVGSGAGFPGMALQLTWPGLQVTLVDSNAKKAAFLKTVARAFGLGRVLLGRLEEIEAQADIVTARALEHMEEAGPERYRRLLVPGGTCAFWIGEKTAAEWQERCPEWTWSPSLSLPGSECRTITLAQPRP